MRITSMMAPYCTVVCIGSRKEIFLNAEYTDEQLRWRLSRFGSKSWVDEILSKGTRLGQNEIRWFVFGREGKIITYTNELVWFPCRKGDRANIYYNGCCEKVLSPREQKRKELLEDILEPLMEVRDGINSFFDILSEKVEKILPL